MELLALEIADDDWCVLYLVKCLIYIRFPIELRIG